MKVSELRSGMLLTTKKNWELRHVSWNAYPNRGGEEIEVGGASTFFTIQRGKQEVFMFVKCVRSDFEWGGVKKHYELLWRGMGVLVTGYEFRLFEEYKRGQNE